RGRTVDRAPADALRPSHRPGRNAVRRQSAEDRAGQVAGDRAEGAHRRRAHPRYRHRHQGRSPPADVEPGCRGCSRGDGVVGVARGPGHGRPGAGHARGPARRGAQPRRGHRGVGDVSRDRAGGGMSLLTKAHESGSDAQARTGSTVLDMVLRFRALGLLLTLAAIVAVTAAVNPRFVNEQSIRDLLLAAAITLLLATGMTVVVLTRGIDLSVGSVLGLSAFCTASLLSENPGIPVPVAMLIGLGIGA